MQHQPKVQEYSKEKIVIHQESKRVRLNLPSYWEYKH
nr:MAG TPA: hypothetical protein [Caudoviricetes sp.]